LVRNSVVLAVYLLFSVACFLTVHEHKGMACFIIAVTIFCFLSGQNNNAALHIISELPACAARKVKQRAASPSLPQ